MERLGRQFNRVLVVEDDVDQRRGIARFAASWGLQVLEAGTAGEAIALLQPPPDLIILDIRLPDESGFAVLEAAQRVLPAPIKIAFSGVASPEEAFRLAKYGVRAYLQKPVSFQQLEAAVRDARGNEPELTPLVQGCVGHLSVREVQRNVRDAMVGQALALADGNRTGAARLLHVSRQAVQQMIRHRDEDPPRVERKLSP